MKLDQDRIIAAGLTVLDRDGLEMLNMRAIARELGVGASALYRHVANKSQLISLMADGFYRQAYDAAQDNGDWRQWLIAYGHGFRSGLVGHRDSALLCASARPKGDVSQSSGDWLIAPLLGAGISRENAFSYIGSVTSLALGWTIYQQSSALHDVLAAVMDFDESFDTGLEALVAGYTGI